MGKKSVIVDTIALFSGDQAIDDIIAGGASVHIDSEGEQLHESRFIFDMADVFSINTSTHHGFTTVRFSCNDLFTVKLPIDHLKKLFFESRGVEWKEGD